MQLITFVTPTHAALSSQLLTSRVEDFEVTVVRGAQIGSGVFREPGFREVMHEKLCAVRRAATGDFVYTDADVIFLQPAVEAILAELEDYDCLFQNDSLSPDGPYCAGLFAMRCNQKTLGLLDAAVAAMDADPGLPDDQIALNRVLSGSGCRYGMLSNRFANLCTLGRVPWDHKPVYLPADTLAFHANWVKGLDTKAALLAAVG
jgi:hypothetical protein